MPNKKPVKAVAQPIAVLQVLPRLKEGGVEESTLAMAHYLLKPRAGQRWAPHVAAAYGKGTEALQRLDIPYHRLPLASKNPLVWIWLAFKLVGLIRAHNIRLVHARSRASAWPARWAAWWCKIPFVTTFHGHYGTRGGYLKRFYNSIMLAGPLVIANSQFTAKHIALTYKVNPQRVRVAARGVDTTIFNPENFTPTQLSALRKSLKIPTGVPLLLMVGRLTAWKGQHILLEALSQLPHRRFVVAFAGGPEGRGHYATDLYGFAQRLKLDKQVRWLGARADVPALLAASTLAFSCSTRPEAFGRAAIEAMAMGVPIIASAHGGSMETIIPNQTGWLVPVGAHGEVLPQALSQTIAKALRNRAQLATMRLHARKHVLQHYTAARMCRTELSAYLTLLGLTATT